MSDQELPVHPAANLFPLMEGKPFTELVEDIKRHGLQSPISILPDGRLIDGRNRLRACKEAGVKTAFVEVNPEDPVAFAVSANKHRRHLTSSQLAALAVTSMREEREKAKERQREGGRDGGEVAGRGRPRKERVPEKVTEACLDRTEGEAREVVAKRFGTNACYVQVAERLSEEAPDLLEQVKSGEKHIVQARDEMRDRKGTRAQITANAAFQRAAEFVAHVEGVAGRCLKVRVDAIRRDERLHRHWIEACKGAMKALKELLRQLEEQ